MARHDAPDRTNMPQGSKQKTGCQNVHKAPGQSQLSKTDTGALERNGPTRPEHARSGDLTQRDTSCPTERRHKGANGKWVAQTCTRHPSGHNLEKMIRAPSNETTQPDPNAPGRATSHGATRCTRPNDATREQMANGLPKCAQGTRAVTT